MKTDALILFSHLKVQNANAISSPLTWGFPSITAILGFIHALQRKLQEEDNGIFFQGVGVICHAFDAQTYQATKFSDHIFCLTRNPLNKEGESSSINEEGRAHMEISLLLQAQGSAFLAPSDQIDKKLEKINLLVQSSRIAGGSILPSISGNSLVKYFPFSKYDDFDKKNLRKLLPSLLPGFVLIDRKDLLAQRTLELQQQDPDSTAFDALLEFSSIQYEPSSYDLSEEKTIWKHREKNGWITPIPVGYQAISQLHPPGVVKNVRDKDYPFQFVENIYSLGQWISPHRLEDINDIFWSYDYTLIESGVYRCVNDPKQFIKTLKEESKDGN